MRRILSLYRGLNIRLGASAVFDQAVVGGTNFLVVVFVGRFCGPSELGLFALATTTWYLVLAFLESLITSPFTVFVHRLDDHRRTTYAGSAIAHVIGLAAIATTGLGLASALLYWLEYTKLAIVFAALVVTIPFRLLRQFARRFHYATLSLSRALVLDVSVAVLQIGALASLYLLDVLTAAGAFLGVGCAYGVVLAVWLARYRRSFQIRKEWILSDLLKNWALGRWIAASQITLSAAAHSLPWIIALLLNETQTGIFFSCMMLVGLSAPLLAAVQNILVPRSSAAYAESGLVGLRRVVKKTTVVLASGMGFLTALLVVFGDLLVRLSFGNEFEGQQTVVALLGMKAFVYALSLGAASGLTVLERNDLVFRSHLVGVLVTMTMAIALIGKFGLSGAAAAHLTGTTLGSVIVVLCYRRIVRNLQEGGLSGPPEQAPNTSPKSSCGGELTLDPESL